MDPINDPEMKEIVQDFTVETKQLLGEMEESLEEFEESFDRNALENFGQIIDRVMGAAKSIGAKEIGQYCELGKIIGYKSSQCSDQKLLQVVSAVLFDTVDFLNKMNESLISGDDTELKSLNTETFASRLKWLSDKFKDIERASVTAESTQVKNQGDLDALLKDLGL